MFENQVFQWNGSSYRLLRVVNDKAVLYPMEGKSIHELRSVPLQEFRQAEENNEFRLLDDPYQQHRERNFDGKASEKMRANYALIAELVPNPALLAGAHARASLLDQAAGGDPVLKRKIYRLLNIYWLKGQTPSALIPEYGKRTRSRVYTKKPGRQSADGVQGVVISEDISQMFDLFCRQHLLSGKKTSVAEAYRLFLTSYREQFPQAGIPTLKQFRYYYDTRFTQAQRSVGRNSAIAWAKDKRPLSGTAKAIALGIGHCYELDSTLADQSLVSDFDRTLVIGRPTLWSVTDRASGLIVGIHISMDPPSLQGAYDALYNAFSPKKAYCARFGIEIDDSDWPACGLPRTVITDNAELLSDRAADVARTLGIWFENAASYRADSKGTVESSFGGLQRFAEALLPMSVNTVANKKAGGGDNRLDAELTLSEYTGVMINMVLVRNRHVLETTPVGYPASLPANPLACWQWALSVKDACCLRTPGCSQEALRIALLVKEKCTVSENGLRCKGFCYTLPRGETLGWFDRGQGVRRPQGMKMAINPDDVSSAWLFTDPANAPFESIKCELGAKDAEYAGMTLFEAQRLRQVRCASRREAKRQESEETAKRFKAAQQIVSAAHKVAIKSSASKAQRLKEIGENKTMERILQAKANPRVAEQDKPAQPASVAEKATPFDPLAALLTLDN